VLDELVADLNDQVGTMLDPDNAATRYLGRFIDFLLDANDIGDGAVHADHIGTTLLDLAALVLGARKDAAELARVRGLRSARTQAIIAAIRTGYANPAFSVRDVARRLRLSPRYVQNLLGETGVSFVERVLELRLQRARRMLADQRCDRLRISEIAEACGFNEVSYFNRCVRRRFGVSPGELRGPRA
jgi:AraC-like DNA-binding protein